MVPSRPLLSCESSVSVKENSDRKKTGGTTSQENITQHTLIFMNRDTVVANGINQTMEVNQTTSLNQ